MGLKLDGLTINEWLATDQQFLETAKAVRQAYEQGRQARGQADQRKAAR